MKFLHQLLLAFCIIALSIPIFQSEAHSQNATWIDENSSRCEIFQAISSQLPKECQFSEDRSLAKSSRSIVHHYAESPPSPIPQVPPPPAAPMAIAVQIHFAFDSAELDDSSKEILSRITSVLNDNAMQNTVIQIEGHTDSTGTEDYNMKLSHARAQTVQRYLMAAGISEQRLPTSGQGESRPYDPNDPAAAVNRRVEFINITN